MGATDDDLHRLLEATQLATGPESPVSFTLPDDKVLPEMLRLVSSFDADRLTRILLGEWVRLGPHDFLGRRLVARASAVRRPS